MKVIYPGSFNPWHKGHQYVYDSACEIFGKENVYLGVAKNPRKVDSLSDDDETIKWKLAPITKNVIIVPGLLVDTIMANSVELIIRGVRDASDLNYEASMSRWNNNLSTGIKTIFIPTQLSDMDVSSSVIRELDSFGRDCTYICGNEYVYGRWKQKYPKNKIYCGPTCCGKTSYIKKKDNGPYRLFSADQKIWECLSGEVNKDEIKSKFIEAMSSGDTLRYKCLLKDFAFRVNWREVFSYDIIDFAALGVYFPYIPSKYLSKSEIVLCKCERSVRLERSRQRMTEERFNMLEKFYQDPLFYDKELNIS